MAAGLGSCLVAIFVNRQVRFFAPCEAVVGTIHDDA